MATRPLPLGVQGMCQPAHPQVSQAGAFLTVAAGEALQQSAIVAQLSRVTR